MPRPDELVRIDADRDPAAVAAAVAGLLRALPDWFGIESAITSYIDDASTLPGYVAYDGGGGDPIGVLLVKRHFPGAAEIHLMAVAPAWHRRGVGRSLVRRAEQDLIADGVRIVQVKTLGASKPHDGYAATRRFYLVMGYEPLEEFADLWPGNPCLLLVKAFGRSW